MSLSPLGVVGCMRARHRLHHPMSNRFVLSKAILKDCILAFGSWLFAVSSWVAVTLLHRRLHLCYWTPLFRWQESTVDASVESGQISSTSWHGWNSAIHFLLDKILLPTHSHSAKTTYISIHGVFHHPSMSKTLITDLHAGRPPLTLVTEHQSANSHKFACEYWHWND